MKQLLTFLIFCLSISISNDLAAQGQNKFNHVEKKDTTYAILGSGTHSGSECGHHRSSEDPRPTFRIVIVDLELGKIPTVETSKMSYQGSVQTQILKPYRKSHNFKFRKVGGSKLNPNWIVDVPCYVEEATFTIDLKYKNKGKVKPLNINSKSSKNQMTISVDFINQKVYSLDKGKKLMGSFNQTLASIGKKQGMADKASIKLRVE